MFSLSYLPKKTSVNKKTFSSLVLYLKFVRCVFSFILEAQGLTSLVGRIIFYLFITCILFQRAKKTVLHFDNLEHPDQSDCQLCMLDDGLLRCNMSFASKTWEQPTKCKFIWCKWAIRNTGRANDAAKTVICKYTVNKNAGGGFSSYEEISFFFTGSQRA